MNESSDCRPCVNTPLCHLQENKDAFDIETHVFTHVTTYVSTYLSAHVSTHFSPHTRTHWCTLCDLQENKDAFEIETLEVELFGPDGRIKDIWMFRLVC